MKKLIKKILIFFKLFYFIKQLYLQYLQDPTSIPESWKDFFDALANPFFAMA